MFFFAPKNIKKTPSNLLIIGPDTFFHYCQSAQIQPKSQFLFHKILALRDFSIMTLYENDLRFIFGQQWPKFRVGLDVQPGIPILKGLY